ncbi:MAG: hypothetical protein WD898_02575 [Candidatus Paceibacterota bacterium]
MSDLTIIYLTTNELPEEWTAYHKKVLLEAVGNSPLITISKKPLDFGVNILQTEPKSMSNIYWQLLKGAKLATTKYIAVAEDDTLYHKEHFEHRPKDRSFAYNMNHWSLFTWKSINNPKPTYSWRNRKGNYCMIAERELVIEALEERFTKYPDGTPDRITGEMGRPMVENNLGITRRPSSEFYTTISVINFNHDGGSDDLQQRHRKRLGMIRAYDIPFWGKAKDLVKHFK